MRKIVFLCLIFSAAIFCQNKIDKSTANTIFERGNEYYKFKEYEKALEEYLSIEQAGFESAELYYNIGNSYFKTGKLGYATLYFERGARINPADEDIRHNLQFVNAKNKDKIETLPTLFLFEWIQALSSIFSISGWAVVVLCLIIVICVFIALFFISSSVQINKLSFIGSIVSVFLLVFSIIFLVIRINNYNSENFAIIVNQSVTVKSAPDDSSVDAFVIHEGLKIRLDDKVENWYRIKLEDGKVGWLKQGDFVII